MRAIYFGRFSADFHTHHRCATNSRTRTGAHPFARELEQTENSSRCSMSNLFPILQAPLTSEIGIPLQIERNAQLHGGT